MSGPREDFAGGVRAVSPALPANVAFGVIVGVGTVAVGGTVAETIGLSAAFFAGAAQLAALEVLGRDGPLAIAIVTALLVNLRYTMYSAGIAPYFRRHSARWKAVVSYFLLDMTFALSVARFRDTDDVTRRWYYLGTALPLWLSWLAGVAVGAFLGADVPGGLHLEFAFPLLFMAMLFPTIEGRFTATAGVVAAVVAVAGAGLPFNLGLIAAALAGIAAGVVTEETATDEHDGDDGHADDGHADGGHDGDGGARPQ